MYQNNLLEKYYEDKADNFNIIEYDPCKIHINDPDSPLLNISELHINES